MTVQAAKLKILWIICFIVYGFLNAYIGLRLWQMIVLSFPQPLQILVDILYLILVSSLLVGKIGTTTFPGKLSNLCFKIGLYWFAAMYYFLLFFIVIDFIRVVVFFAGFSFGNERDALLVGWVVIALVSILLLYGTWNAKQPQIKEYNVTINKSGHQFKQLKIAAIADMHLGLFMNKQATKTMLAMVDQIRPDIVLFLGDVIDETIGCFVDNQLADLFQKLKPPLGVFGILGNHEYIWGHADKGIYYLEQAGIVILRDCYIKIADSFYLVGRDDKGKKMVSGQSRKPLSEAMNGIDHSFPIILMDHQPGDIEQSRHEGVDLQLSGHTHAGQLVPFNLIIKLFYKITYGYLRVNHFQCIVSCGFGGSGPPVRVGSTPEIVQVTIHFQDQNCNHS